MSLGGSLSSSDKKKARKTPVHGAVNKFLGGLKGSSKKAKSPSLRGATKRNRAAYQKDVAKAKAAGWYQIKGKWVKTRTGKAMSYPQGKTPSVKPKSVGAWKSTGIGGGQALATNKRKAKKRGK